MRNLHLLLACYYVGCVVGQLEPFTSGARLLFIGHSFFIPIGNQMDFGVTNLAASQYPNHSWDSVFRGGESGSPQQLWQNDRPEVEQKLQAGVDLFGMTAHEGTAAEDYVRWIDLALSKNADIKIFIGIPWADSGPLKTTSTYAADVSEGKDLSFAIVEELREKYPWVPIYLLTYGFVAQRMRELFDDNNQLADNGIVNVCCSREDSLFRDENPGHQGDMMRDVAALFWLQFLYGDSTVQLPGYNQADVDDIISFAHSQIAGLNNQILTTRPPSSTPAPTPPLTSGGGDGGGGGLGCFPEHATAMVQGKGRSLMKDLQIGDWVQTSNGAYESIYAFGHVNPKATANFVKIDMVLSSRASLEMTREHLVYLANRKHPIRADAVIIGDRLVAEDLGSVEVTKVSMVQRKGLYAPLTPSGSLLINGIKVSNYIALQDASPEFVQLQHGTATVSHQDLAHVFMSPYRTICRTGVIFSSAVPLCQLYNDEDMPSYVSSGIWLGQRLDSLSLPSVIQGFLLMVFLLMLGSFFVVESILAVAASSSWGHLVLGLCLVGPLCWLSIGFRLKKTKTI